VAGSKMAMRRRKNQLIKITQANLDNKKTKKLNPTRDQHNKRLAEFISFHRTSGDKRKKLYEKFLNSELWDDRRTKLFGEYDKACEVCNSEKIVQVHHNNYAQILGEERNKDLVILCKDCHNLFHSKSYVKDPSKYQSNGYWHKGHYMIDVKHANRHCSICSYAAKYIIFREARKRHILFCRQCLDILKYKMGGSTGEEIKTGMPITVMLSDDDGYDKYSLHRAKKKISARHKPTVHRRRKKKKD